MYAGSLPEGIVPSGTPERDNDSLYGTPKEEVGPNAQAIHFQGNRERVWDSGYHMRAIIARSQLQTADFEFQEGFL